MQYYGQLNDIEIESPSPDISSVERIEELIAAFESAYGKLYARSAASPELGYLITQAVVRGRVGIEKPSLVEMPATSGSPPAKGVRSVYWSVPEPGFVDTDIYEMEQVRNGHVIEGPAVIEAAATTFPVPPDRRVYVDANDIFHLENREGAQ
jgi:N-methylhydantoinase A/oxoprolinase/acetone carboxylase beta subunit